MAKYEIHNAHINHQHINGASKAVLQEQADIIENKLLQASGNLAVSQQMALGPSNGFLTEASDALGEAISALLKVKQVLGLETNLSESSQS